MKFDRCRVSMSRHGDIEMSMDGYMAAIQFLLVDRYRRKEQEEKMTKKSTPASDRLQ